MSTTQAAMAAEPPDMPAADRGRILLCLSAAAFCSAAAMRVTDAMLPAFEQAFNVSLATAAQSITLFAICYGALQLLFGPVGDRYGKLRTIGWACVGCAVASLLCGLATGFTALVTARALAGAMGAAIIPLSMAWIGDELPYEHRQPVLARFLIGQIMGFAAGIAVGGVAADTVGWRVPFFFLAAMFLASAVALLRMRRRDDARLSAAAQVGLTSKLFTVVSQPWARVVLLAVAVEGGLAFGAMAFIASHLHLRFGLPLAIAGSVVMGYGFGGLIYALRARWFVARFGERGLTLMGGVLLGSTMLVVALTPWWPLAVPACVIGGLGFYMLHNTLQMNATQMAPTHRGAAVAVFASMLFVGQSLGVWLASLVIARVDGYQGTSLAIGLAATGLPVLGWWFSRALRRRPV